MTRLDPADYLTAIVRESTRFRDVLAGCDPGARVPACPDWDASDLLWHLTEVQWFWSTIIRTRPAGPSDDNVPPQRPDSYDALLALFDECSAGLVRELDAADPGEPAYSWAETAPDGQTVGFTYRRQAHEALIHRLDAEQTAGTDTVTDLDPALAADGVAETLDVMFGGQPPAWGRVEAGHHHVRVEVTDRDVAIDTNPCTFFGTDPESGKNYDGPHILVVDDPGTEPDAVVSGAASDLDTWLWKRRGQDGITITGDDAAADAFLAAVSHPLD